MRSPIARRHLIMAIVAQEQGDDIASYLHLASAQRADRVERRSAVTPDTRVVNPGYQPPRLPDRVRDMLTDYALDQDRFDRIPLDPCATGLESGLDNEWTRYSQPISPDLGDLGQYSGAFVPQGAVAVPLPGGQPLKPLLSTYPTVPTLPFPANTSGPQSGGNVGNPLGSGILGPYAGKLSGANPALPKKKP